MVKKTISKTINFRRHEECITCGGNGAKAGTSPQACDYCGGQGQVLQSSGIFRLQTTCPACRGAGTIVRDKCGDCSGQGQTEVTIERKVTIPAGVDTGTRIRLSGKGEAGLRGGPAGDLYIFVNVDPHAIFTRDGNNLYARIPLPMTVAALGGNGAAIKALAR